MPRFLVSLVLLLSLTLLARAPRAQDEPPPPNDGIAFYSGLNIGGKVVPLRGNRRSLNFFVKGFNLLTETHGRSITAPTRLAPAFGIARNGVLVTVVTGAELKLARDGKLTRVDTGARVRDFLLDAYEDPLFGFEDPALEFAERLESYDDPLFGFDDPLVGYEDPIFSYEPYFGGDDAAEALALYWEMNRSAVDYEYAFVAIAAPTGYRMVRTKGGGIVFPFVLRDGRAGLAEPVSPEAEALLSLDVPASSALRTDDLALRVGPNPARGAASVSFALAGASDVRVTVFDALGREVAVLADGPRQPGEHVLPLDGSDLLTGTYLVRLVVHDRVETKRLTLTR